MKYSIKIRFVVVLMVLLSSAILFCWVINWFFLEKFYENYKIKKLGNTFVSVNSRYSEEYDDEDDDEEDEGDEDLSLEFEQLSSKQNVSLYIFNTFEYTNGIILEIKYPTSMNDVQNKRLQKDIVAYYYPSLLAESDVTEQVKALVEKDNYSIYKHFDSRLEVNYMELYGTLDSGEYIFIRTNYDNIMESAGIANKFFGYVGAMTVLIGSMIMYFIGAGFAKPICRLSEITEEISNLNFDVSYEDKRMDEVGKLGKSINSLSEKLENTISSLKSANNELENDIRKREKSEEMRREFLSNVTHELKTPIALIQGYAEGLKDNIQDDAESRNFYCDVIIDESAKMNNIVKKLLSLSELEFGNSNPNFDRFDITALCTSIAGSMDRIYRQKGIVSEIKSDIPVSVWADEYLVEEVVTNYISNALNHTEADEKGRKVIAVDIKQLEDRVRVSVFNTGKPIPEEEIEKIWDKFYKVDKARTREYGGSGIGLSIVKAIMTSLNRECGVNNWDNGVEFWFELDTGT